MLFKNRKEQKYIYSIYWNSARKWTNTVQESHVIHWLCSLKTSQLSKIIRESLILVGPVPIVFDIL